MDSGFALTRPGMTALGDAQRGLSTAKSGTAGEAAPGVSLAFDPGYGASR